ncbi:MAG: LUD domain-containing protein [Burkholderiales bacterium]|nr:LUD domain-containing protein [Burkholderiales bacterium]
MSTARERILARLRTQSGNAPAHLASPIANGVMEDDPIARFMARANALQSTAERLASLDTVPLAVAAYLQSHKLPQQLVCWPQYDPLDWAGASIVRAPVADSHTLVGLTGCFAAIAETGTLMLCSSATTPAITSLLPETHIAVVMASQIVRTMEEGFQRLQTTLGRPPRAVNFVSGPSRTGDIEQTMTLGAHGPYRVHLLLVG